MCTSGTVKEYIEKHNSANRILNYYPEESFGKYYKINVRYLPNRRQIKKEDINVLCENIVTETQAVVALTDTGFARNGIMELSIATMNRNYNEMLIIKALEIVREFFRA